MRYMARKGLTLLGHDYMAGDVVPPDALASLDARLVGKLVDQRRIIPAPASMEEEEAPRESPPTPAKRKRKSTKRKMATARR